VAKLRNSRATVGRSSKFSNRDNCTALVLLLHLFPCDSLLKTCTAMAETQLSHSTGGNHRRGIMKPARKVSASSTNRTLPAGYRAHKESAADAVTVTHRMQHRLGSKRSHNVVFNPDSEVDLDLFDLVGRLLIGAWKQTDIVKSTIKKTKVAKASVEALVQKESEAAAALEAAKAAAAQATRAARSALRAQRSARHATGDTADDADDHSDVDGAGATHSQSYASPSSSSSSSLSSPSCDSPPKNTRISSPAAGDLYDDTSPDEFETGDCDRGLKQPSTAGQRFGNSRCNSALAGPPGPVGQRFREADHARNMEVYVYTHTFQLQKRQSLNVQLAV
jgi:hypothetical protein